MPTLYEYFGIIVYFFSNDHEPIHVHAKCENRICKAVLTVENGKVTTIKIKLDGENIPLRNDEIKKLDELLKFYSDDIVNKWKEFFLLNKKIKKIKITKKLK